MSRLHSLNSRVVVGLPRVTGWVSNVMMVRATRVCNANVLVFQKHAITWWSLSFSKTQQTHPEYGQIKHFLLWSWSRHNVQTILIGSGRKCMFCRMFCACNLCVLLTLPKGCLLCLKSFASNPHLQTNFPLMYKNVPVERLFGDPNAIKLFKKQNFFCS
jgi:hypothetical protein